MTQITWDCAVTSMPSIPSLNFDPYGDPWGTVTPVRPTDMPRVLLALQPGLWPTPYGLPVPLLSNPLLQDYGGFLHPGPRHRHSRVRARVGPRRRDRATGQGHGAWTQAGRLGVSGPHGAESGRKQPHPAAVLPKSDNGQSRAQDDKQEEGELIRALNPLSQKAPPAPAGHSCSVGQNVASRKGWNRLRE